MKRKTIEVSELKSVINERIAKFAPTPEARKELESILSYILHRTGNYGGFNYVAWLDGGCERWEKDGRPLDNTPYLGDQTKVRFY